MNTADDGTPKTNRQPEEADLGPEPAWLLDTEEGETVSGPADPDEPAHSPEPAKLTEGSEQPDLDQSIEDVEESVPVESATPVESREPVEEPTVEFAPAAAPDSQQRRQRPTPSTRPSRSDSEVAEQPRRTHPWLWGAIPLVLLLATGVIAWFGTTQTLNGFTTWEAIRVQQPPLLPARWAMTVWWLVLPLIGMFLIYGMLPAGRVVTRIKTTGPLISIALVGSSVWIFAQHWEWKIIALVSMGIAMVALLASYLLVALGPAITKFRQRFLAVLPLSAALVYGLLLTVLSWQSYSSQPFGERGSSVLFSLLMVIIAAIFAFFMRDGLFALILSIWFAGVMHQQWGEDAVISLVGAVTLLFAVALAALGTILATESHRPSLTTSVEAGRGRTSFFRRKKDSPSNELE